MNNYITGTTIKTLQEKKQYTQNRLAQLLGVSDKAVYKWGTGKGLPDITLIEPLAKALGVSVIELMAGQQTENRNISANLLRSKFYACPICGNVLYASGNAEIRLQLRGMGRLYIYCNRHGLIRCKKQRSMRWLSL